MLRTLKVKLFLMTTASSFALGILSLIFFKWIESNLPTGADLTAINRIENFFIVILGTTTIALSFFSYLFATGLHRKLTSFSDALIQQTSEFDLVSNDLTSCGNQIKVAATSQSSAIQETASSIDEMSSMIKKSAENASFSQKKSSESKLMAEKGQKAVQDMVASIEEIDQSTQNIMSQISESNQEISEIVKVISEIGSKTKVINDIVFQTKLLSFNASVEAARAGEHGKGFAVVAEEVGNLAQMSGNAAKEISTMLEEGIKKVNHIVSDTTSKVNGLMIQSKEKVSIGTQTAQQCHDSLKAILGSVNEVDQLVSEISSAAQEQASGVSEINTAMNRLNQGIQQNISLAHRAEQSSLVIRDRSSELRDLALTLSSPPKATPTATAIAEIKIQPPVTPERISTPEPQQPAKVIALPKKESAPVPIKADLMVAGSDVVPEANDPRFEEL